MGAKLNNLKQLFSNLRTRSIMLITGGVLVLIVIIGVIGMNRSNQETPANVTLTTVRQIQATPGLKQVTPEYAKVQQQLNKQLYEKAVREKGSAIPTIIGIDETGANGGAGGTGAAAGGGANGGAAGMNGAAGSGLYAGTLEGSNAPNAGATGPGGQGTGTVGAYGVGGANGGAGGAFGLGPNAGGAGGTLTPEEQQLRAQMAALQQQQALASTQVYQQQVQRTQQAMQTQAQQLINSWSGKASSAQVYVASPVNITKTPAEIAAAQAAVAAEEAAKPSAPIIKAGDVVFAVLDTGVNSDEPSPVMATILSGPLKGGKLVGGLSPTASLPGTNGPTKVILDFNRLSIPSAPASISISAVAIDPDTARTALASDVDHHYLQRYGSVFAAAFLQGYGNAVQQSGTEVLVGPLGNTTIAAGSLNGFQEVTAGLGQVGQQWGSQLNEALSRQNTVTVNAGISIGILFLSDVRLDENNYATPGGQQTGVPAAIQLPTAGQPQSQNTNMGNLAPAAPAATPPQNTVQNNQVQSRRIAPGVTQQWGPVYPIYTQEQP